MTPRRAARSSHVPLAPYATPMPKGDPFTALCQLAAATDTRVVADLHLHTTASDGDLTPSQLVHVARNANLDAIAVTDHDTVTGYDAALDALRTFGIPKPEIVPGVEVSAEFEGREVHVLGLFVDPSNAELSAALAASCAARRERFRRFVAALATGGAALDPGAVEGVERASVSLGRRHLAGLLVRAGHARTRFDAFQRFLQPLAAAVPATHLIPVARVVELLRGAGGLSALAHPGERFDEAALTRLAELGLTGIEVRFPAANLSRTAELVRIAGRLGLVCTGGTDLHAAGDRAIGSVGLARAEWVALKSRPFGS